MTRPRTRCTFTECTRYARPGETRCTTHKNAVDRGGAPKSPLEKQLEHNDYGKYHAHVMQAAHDGDAEGLDNEIAVLRSVLKRLLTEEDDTARLASGVAKIGNTIINAMKAQRTLSGDAADDFTSAVALILDELAP